MKHYIFITPEGFTYQPDSESFEPDIENLQVLGFDSGDDADAAYRNLLQNSEWLLNTSFDEVWAYEVTSKEIGHYFYLSLAREEPDTCEGL